MEHHAENLKRKLDQTEGFCELGMWEHAWSALDDLPDDLRAHPDVISRRLDVLIGLMDWNKGLILATSLSKLMPQRADVWFRLACIHARLEVMDDAKKAIARCIEIDPAWRARILAEPALEGVW